MLLRRYRETPDVDPAFSHKPVETLDPAFRAPKFVDSDVNNDSRLTPAETAAALKGKALDEALAAASLDTSGKADEKRARYAEWLAAQESINPDEADVNRDPKAPETDLVVPESDAPASE